MYEIILLDADDTLLDYKKSEDYAITQTFKDFGYFNKENSKIDFPIVREKYTKINDDLWKKLEKGLITPENLRKERFELLFKEINLNYDPHEFGLQYLKRLSEGTFLIDGAKEFCKYLHKKYRLGIVTNGIGAVQLSRIKNSEISKYMEHIIISSDFGVSKPNPKIFEYALKKFNHTNKDTVLMIGDSISADILGGKNFGIDTCLINIKNNFNNKSEYAKYTVNNYEELYKIL